MKTGKELQTILNSIYDIENKKKIIHFIALSELGLFLYLFFFEYHGYFRRSHDQ